MVVRAEAYHAVGGLDAEFFAHQEEIDLCWRLQRAGYEIIAFPEVAVRHLGGGTLSYGSPFKTYLNFRNSLILLIKNEKSPWLPKLLWRMVLDGVAAFKFLLGGQVRHFLSVFRAHVYIWSRIGALSRKRQVLLKRIEEVRIGAENTFGRKAYSIIYRYFLRGQKTYAEIEANE